MALIFLSNLFVKKVGGVLGRVALSAKADKPSAETLGRAYDIGSNADNMIVGSHIDKCQCSALP